MIVFVAVFSAYYLMNSWTVMLQIRIVICLNKQLKALPAIPTSSSMWRSLINAVNNSSKRERVKGELLAP